MTPTRVYSVPVRAKKKMRWMKPERFQHYKTLGELAEALHVDPKTLRRLEKAGITPEPQRVSRGRITIRLFSPENEADIAQILQKKEYRNKTGPKPKASKANGQKT